MVRIRSVDVVMNERHASISFSFNHLVPAMPPFYGKE